ncbi:MAG: hypothetical protein ACRENE_22110 [Polyangiaceae bacterium]
MRKLFVPLAWAAAAFAPFAACSSDHHGSLWSMTPSVPAQPTVPVGDYEGPPLPGCPCEPTIEVDVTVTDSAGDPVDGVSFSGPPYLHAACVGADGGADAGAPDEGVNDSGDGGDASDAVAADAALDATEARPSACLTWRVSFPMTIVSQEVGFDILAPGYARFPLRAFLSQTQCCEPVPAISASAVLKPLPACPVAYRPCILDAGGYRDSLTCACP